MRSAGARHRIPEIVNLVFFKIVRSKSKFWQMLGRGTRLRPDLFGPGRHKTHFSVFDFCQNFEFFNQNPDVAEPASSESLGKRLFTTRVVLVAALDEEIAASPADAGEDSTAGAGVTDQIAPAEFGSLTALRHLLAERLREEVAGMSLDNFLVRPKRRLVETYVKPESWGELTLDVQHDLVDGLAGLPSALTDDDQAAKEFDLLCLRAQLAALRNDPAIAREKDKIVKICGLLEELENVPMVAREMALIQEVQTEDFWIGVTAPILEAVRRRLRKLVQLIEVRRRPIIYTDFEDEIGEARAVSLPGAGVGTDMDRFRLKAMQFLNENANHIAVLKVRRNEPLTPTDLAELERIFVDAGVAGNDDIERLRAEGGLGLFVRSLVGLDREAAKTAFSTFTSAHVLSAHQIEFVNLIIDHLTERARGCTHRHGLR